MVDEVIKAAGDLPNGLRFILLLVVILGGFYLQSLRIRGVKDEASEAKDAGKLAAVRSLPTSNGFAADTKEALDSIRECTARLTQAVETMKVTQAEYAVRTDQRLGRMEGILMGQRSRDDT